MLRSRLFGRQPIRSTCRSRAGRKSAVETLESRQVLSVGHTFGSLTAVMASQIRGAADFQKVHNAVADVAGGNAAAMGIGILKCPEVAQGVLGQGGPLGSARFVSD